MICGYLSIKEMEDKNLKDSKNSITEKWKKEIIEMRYLSKWKKIEKVMKNEKSIFKFWLNKNQ